MTTNGFFINMDGLLWFTGLLMLTTRCGGYQYGYRMPYDTTDQTLFIGFHVSPHGTFTYGVMWVSNDSLNLSALDRPFMEDMFNAEVVERAKLEANEIDKDLV